MREKLQTLSLLLTAALTFLLPLKCGNMILPGVPQSWPDGVIGWIVTAPPAAFFVLTSAFLLLFALAAFGAPKFGGRSAGAALLALWWVLPLISLLGWVKASNLEYGVVQFSYFLGLSAYAGTVAVILTHRGSRAGGLLLSAACAGVLVTALVGVHQYFFGFDDLRNFVLEQEKKSGMKFPDGFKARIWDRRTYATFTFASALAGCLLLAGPAAVLRLYQWGDRMEPRKLSRRLLAGLGALLLIGVFFSTKGRGAFLAALLTLALAAVCCIRNFRWKMAILTVLLASILAGAAYIHYAGRGFGSMSERIGYWITSGKILLEEPLTGSGWGDFMHHHAKVKFMGNGELARDPHNLIASFGAAMGVPGLLFALLLLGLPLAAARHIPFSGPLEKKVLLAGLTAFALHSCMDLDLQVPGLMALMILLQFLLVLPETPVAGKASGTARKLLAATGVAVALAAAAGAVYWTLADRAQEMLLNESGQAVGEIGLPTASPARVRQLVERAARIAPYATGPYLAGGNCMMKFGTPAEAEAYYRKALELSPEYYLIYLRLSEAAARRGDAAKAKELHREAEKRFPLYFQLKGQGNESQ